MAFVARDLGDEGNDMERRFDFAITYDRDLSVEAARAMIGRLSAVSETAATTGASDQPIRTAA